LELEAMEKQIQELLVRQTELRERRAALESSRVSIQRDTNTLTTSTPCASLHRYPSLRRRDTTDPGCSSSGRTSPPPPPPVFEISTRNRFAPLRETERDAVIVGDSIVRYVRATLAKGKVHTHCFPGARVLDVSAQIPAILKDGESVGAIVLHAGVNDTKLRQTEPDRDGSQHVARDEDHRVRTASHISTLFRADGLHPSRVGAELLSDNISRTLRSI
ncbi:hypothetical protein M9458_032880, partial [Cirrhinus mrigala]